MKKLYLVFICVILVMCCSCGRGNTIIAPSEPLSNGNIPGQNVTEPPKVENIFTDEIISVIDGLNNLQYTIDEIDDNDLE